VANDLPMRNCDLHRFCELARQSCLKVLNELVSRGSIWRERERRQHQVVHAANVEAKQKQAEESAALKSSLYKLFGERDPYKRGKQLESALNNLFAFAGFLVRDAFTRRGNEGEGIIEQIDGAVEFDGGRKLASHRRFSFSPSFRKLCRSSNAAPI
jgi:hypothetical protein